MPSVLVDFVPNTADWRYFNATYTTAFPQYSWAQDATTLYALRGSATTGLTNPAWRLNASLLLLERWVLRRIAAIDAIVDAEIGRASCRERVSSPV